MSSRRSHFALILLILLALVGTALLGVPGSPFHRGVNKGLDLQGGLEVVLKAQPPPGHKLTPEDQNRSVSIMRERVDKLGVSSPEIRKQGPDQIVIQLAGVHDPAKAAGIIGSTAQLELYDLEPALIPPSVSLGAGNPVAFTNLHNLLTRVQGNAKSGKPSSYVLFKPVKTVSKTTTGSGKNKKTKTTTNTVWVKVAGPTATLHRDPTTGNAGLLDPYKGKTPKGWKVLPVPKNTVVITCRGGEGHAVVCPGDPLGVPAAGKVDYYLFKHGAYKTDQNGPYPNLTGKELKLSGTRQDFDPSSGSPVVLMQFNGKGNKEFFRVTRNEGLRGQIRKQSQHFAIVLDNEIRSFPQIDYTDSSVNNGINPAGNGAQITGLQSLDEAKNLALVLQTGALPVKYVALERTDVSATLGKDSLKQAQYAAIAGLILVALFLLLLYRFLGLVAVIGLGIYGVFMYAAILLFGVTLTLPGFAGLILTIGVAADANVVVFERIKEESRAGKSMKAAIAAGYAKGFHTIIDANVVTAITALILFAVATAGVKGFALMLLIGTVVSLITAVAATRAMLGLLAGFKWFDNPRFMGATANEIPRWQRIDVVGRRRLWFILSLVAIGVSVVALIVQGLNLGIDFKGGTQARFATPAPVSLSAVRDQMAAIGRADAVVQGRGQGNGDLYREFEVRTESLTEPEQTQLEASLTQRLDAQIEGVRNVSASFSRQILKGAIVAIIVSFALIALYVTLRYRWRFAVPILRTLLNDVLITLGVYALSGREVTASTVAAVLTILGFSIYDTIIVFDRVRENMKLMPRASIATIANV